MRHLLVVLYGVVRRPRIALHGAREFRSDFTAHYPDPELHSYDAGRELTHMLTLRRYDQTH